MMHLILLAAGSSRRFGSDKLMWPVDGMPMIAHTLEKLTAISQKHSWDVCVVTREGPVAVLAKDYPVNVCINTDHDSGISTSIKCALAAIPNDSAPAAFFVADQPWLESEMIEAFIAGYEASGLICGCVTHGGESGNPCIFDPGLFGELLGLEGDRGGKRVIMRHYDKCYKHEVADEKQLTDIDTLP